MTRLIRTLLDHACPLGIVATAVVASDGRHQSAALFGVLLVLSAAAFLKARPWSDTAALVAFLFCTWIAGSCTVHRPWMADASHAYSIRPAAVLVCIGCVLQVARRKRYCVSPERPYRTRFAALCAAIALVSALAYVGLARFYDLDFAALREQLLNLLLLAGACLFWSGARSDRRYSVAQRLLPLVGTLAMFAAHVGGARP